MSSKGRVGMVICEEEFRMVIQPIPLQELRILLEDIAMSNVELYSR
jgi:hypothetical protein